MKMPVYEFILKELKKLKSAPFINPQEKTLAELMHRLAFEMRTLSNRIKKLEEELGNGEEQD